MLIEPLEIDAPIAGFNGGAFVKPDGQRHRGEDIARGDVARKTIELIAQHGIDAWLYTAKDWFVHKRKAPARRARGLDGEVRAGGRRKLRGRDLDRAVKIVGVSDDLELVAKARRTRSKAFGDTVSAARSQPYYLDVTHPHANKGDVVGVFSEDTGIPPDEIATIGDMPNDVLMFKKSGFSIAMGNASDEVSARRRTSPSPTRRGLCQGGRALRARRRDLVALRQRRVAFSRRSCARARCARRARSRGPRPGAGEREADRPGRQLDDERGRAREARDSTTPSPCREERQAVGAQAGQLRVAARHAGVPAGQVDEILVLVVPDRHRRADAADQRDRGAGLGLESRARPGVVVGSLIGCHR